VAHFRSTAVKMPDIARCLTRLWIVLSLLLLGTFIAAPPQVAQADPPGVTVQRYYAAWEQQWGTANMTYSDIEPSTGYYPLKLTFTPPTTADYLVIAGMALSNSSTNIATSVQLSMNTVPVFSQSYVPNSAADYATTGFADVFSLAGGTSYTFQVQLMTGGSSTAYIRDATIVVFKITNYYYATDNTSSVFDTGTYQDGLSLSIPSSASGDYLVIASSYATSSIRAKAVYCNWLRGSTSQGEIVRNLVSKDESRGWMMMRVMTFTSTAETIKLQYKVQTPTKLTVNSQHIIAVKLSDLGIDPYSIESEALSSTTSTSYQTKVTQTISPSQQGDYLVMGFAMLNDSSTTAGQESYVRLDIDGVYQAEKVLAPNAATDYIPTYAFKKYRMTSGSHTAKIEYRSATTGNTTSVKNARILAIEVNTLQSYEDAGATTRTVFDAAHNTVYVYGYAYQYQYSPAPGLPMPYKVVYYDGGAGHDGVNGATAYTHNVNSDLNRSIASTLAFTAVPSASYGTWHAVVYRADTGDPAPAATYTPNDPNSVMEIQFTVQADALYTTPPTVDAVSLYDSGHSAEITAMSPQTEYAVKVTVSTPNTVASLSTVKVTIFYDADGTYAPGDVPLSGNTQTAAILTCTVGDTPSWTIDPSTDSTWSIVSANCVQPTLTSTIGDFWFHFKAGKVATATTGSARWHIYAKASNPGGSGDNHQDNRTMNWYGEVAVNTPSVDFGTAAPGSDFSTNEETGISVTFICNGNYNQQVRASSPWTSGLDSVSLNDAGTPGEGEFSLKADDTATLASAQIVSTGYITIGTGTQTSEAGNTVSANTLWLKLGATGMPALTYSGTIYYGITQ